jgi:hypothetical protein
MSRDTPEQIEADLDRLLAARPGEARLRMAAQMFVLARELAVADIRARHPSATDAEMRVQLFERFYADDLSPDDLAYYRGRLGAGREPL